MQKGVNLLVDEQTLGVSAKRCYLKIRNRRQVFSLSSPLLVQTCVSAYHKTHSANLVSVSHWSVCVILSSFFFYIYIVCYFNLLTLFFLSM